MEARPAGYPSGLLPTPTGFIVKAVWACELAAAPFRANGGTPLLPPPLAFFALSPTASWLLSLAISFLGRSTEKALLNPRLLLLSAPLDFALLVGTFPTAISLGLPGAVLAPFYLSVRLDGALSYDDDSASTM